MPKGAKTHYGTTGAKSATPFRGHGTCGTTRGTGKRCQKGHAVSAPYQGGLFEPDARAMPEPVEVAGSDLRRFAEQARERGEFIASLEVCPKNNARWLVTVAGIPPSREALRGAGRTGRPLDVASMPSKPPARHSPKPLPSPANPCSARQVVWAHHHLASMGRSGMPCDAL